jgi:hypothetical protein
MRSFISAQNAKTCSKSFMTSIRCG